MKLKLKSNEILAEQEQNSQPQMSSHFYCMNVFKRKRFLREYQANFSHKFFTLIFTRVRENLLFSKYQRYAYSYFTLYHVIKLR